MSEKNTQSILESIKKKLNKFDQKPENKIADLAGEFDYVAPAKSEESNPQEPVNAPMPSLPRNDLEALTEEDGVEEEHSLDDIDLDDESSVKPVVEQVMGNSQNTESFDDFADEDLEDFEDEIDVDYFEDEEEPIIEENDDDLNFDELISKEEPVLETTAAEVTMSEHDDIDFEKLDFELNNHGVEPSNETAPAPVAADPVSNELEELEREIARQKERAAKEAEVADPLDLEIDFEDESFAVSEVKEEESLAAPKPQFIDQIHEEFPEIKQFEVHLEPIPEKPKMPEVKHFESDIEEIIAPKKTVELPPVQVPAPVAPVLEIPINKVEIESKPMLVSEETFRQTTDSVKKLLDAKNIVSGITSFTQSPMLTELAMQMLEPKLEKWLNNNLSEMVEKIVREEIKKIIPRGE